MLMIWVYIWLFMTACGQLVHEQLVLQLAQEILETPDYSSCSLVTTQHLKSDRNILEPFFKTQGSTYRPLVLFSPDHVTNPVRIKPWNEYLGVTNPQHMYSFTTLPPEIRSYFWPGGPCTLNLFLLDSPEQLAESILQTLAFVRIRNLKDPFLFHFKSGDPERVMYQHPAAGIKFKLATTRNGTHLSLQTICCYCKEGGVPTTTTMPGYPTPYKRGKDLFPDTTRNMRGLLWRYPFYEQVDSHVARRKLEVMGRHHLTGLEKAALLIDEAIGVHMMTIEPAEVEQWDYQMPNGTWTGSVAFVRSGKYEGGAVFVVSREAYLYADISNLGLESYLTFVTDLPGGHIQWNLLVLPLTRGSWVGLLLTTLICGVALCLLLRRESIKASLSYCLANLARIILEQPESLPDLAKVRMLIGSFWIMAVVVTCGYRSKFVEMLTIPEMEKLPEDLTGLFYAGYQILMPVINTMILKQLSASITNPYHIRMLNESDLLPNFRSCMDEVVGTHGVACLMYNLMMDQELSHYYTSTGEPLLQVAPAKEYPLQGKLAFPKGGLYNQAFFDLLHMGFESGSIDHFFDEQKRVTAYMNFNEVGDPEIESGHGPEVLRMHDLKVIFSFWVASISASLCVMLIEMCY